MAASPEKLLQQGLQFCSEAHGMLGEKGGEIKRTADNLAGFGIGKGIPKVMSHIVSSLWDGKLDNNPMTTTLFDS